MSKAISNRNLFLQHVGQTSDAPLCFEIAEAKDALLKDAQGNWYIDAIGGISVANIGHSHPDVLAAIQLQSSKYLHTMVYGEMVQSPQVLYAQALSNSLASGLDTVFFTNSGTEATEGALKLAKRFTGRSKIIAFNNAYHGSTQGALSVLGSEYYRNAYRPLLPNVHHYGYNDTAVYHAIDNSTACVIVEAIQAESGVMPAQHEWLQTIAHKCKQHGALLIIDEAQSGFGRTGQLWAHTQYNIIPDILLLAKAIGGGLPLGAFISSNSIMSVLQHKPVLGHISTFGGHPLSCAAGLAAFNVLCNSSLLSEVSHKANYLHTALNNAGLECHTFYGLWCAVFFKSFAMNKFIIDTCIANGVFTDWFLFANNALRISPPLCISYQQIDDIVNTIAIAHQQYLQVHG
jgi:acetylornithine/N-succinyldiaminopimelate aminotransferase